MIEAAMKTTEVVSEKMVSSAAKGPAGAGESDFLKLLNGKQGAGESQMSQQLVEAMGLSPEKQISTQGISAEGLDIKVMQVGGQDIRSNGKVMELLEGANRNALQMDGIVDWLNSGSQISARQMLSAQVSIGEIVIQTETTTKIAEQGSNSIKTLLQTNVA